MLDGCCGCLTSRYYNEPAGLAGHRERAVAAHVYNLEEFAIRESSSIKTATSARRALLEHATNQLPTRLGHTDAKENPE